MATSPINRILNQSDVLSRLQDHAKRLSRLQKKLDPLLPQYSRGAVHVANLQDGELVLHAESPALATRLNLSIESLRASLQAAGEPVQSIKVKVRTSPFQGNYGAEETPHRAIGTQGKDALRNLGDALSPEDPLAQALKRMVDRSR